MQPVETAFGEMTGEAMLISATRATTLKLANQREPAAPRQPVLMRGAQAFDLPAALAVADPALVCRASAGVERPLVEAGEEDRGVIF